MSRRVSRGICSICSKEFAKNQMTRHVTACAHSSPSSETRFHLIVEGSYARNYWLHLAVKPGTTLADLDNFLRGIWLECCEHLSAFEIDGEQYLSSLYHGAEARSMAISLHRILYPGIKFTHTYDFGTSTELSLRFVGTLEFAPEKKKVLLLARNLAPMFDCTGCGEPATRLCSECSWQDEAWLCDDCSLEHECGEDMLLPIVNSPRMGQCAYTG